MQRLSRWIIFRLALAAVALDGWARAATPVEFNRDVRPILSDTCFKCHGFDKNKRQANLRLDIPDEAFNERKGVADELIRPIVPGDPSKSDAWRRISSTDADIRMPPADSHLVLNEKQKQTIRQWIEQGARYQPHWAFIPVKEPAIPMVANQGWVRNPIDAFVLSRLETEGLEPTEPADRRTLIRRVTFDLTGLPPTPAEVEAFVNDSSPDAYVRVVDRLLASSAYGERMALDWLDAARYGDTHGFNNDTLRSMWPWRDWVIKAFNSNKPYDKFITEQLAGDLLPGATRDQKIATAFNRNHVMNSEGGIINEEYRISYVVDRTTTAANVFMGLTVGCARCHDHKFDPITQKEFYQLSAFFDSLDEVGQIPFDKDSPPLLQVSSKAQEEQLASVAAEIAPLEKAKAQRIALAEQTRESWEPAMREKMKRPVPTTQGLLVHLPLDESATPQAEVTDARRCDARVKVNGKAIPTTGPIKGALQLDGATTLDLGQEVGNFGRDDKFSIAAWINPSSQEAGTIVARMDDVAAFRGYDLLINKGKLEAHVINTWPSNGARVEAKNALPVGEWHHVLLTYDGSSKAAGLKLFVDGQAIAVTVTNDTLTSDSKASNVSLLVGRRSTSAPFKGSIDDVRIYDRTLSTEEAVSVVGVNLIGEMLAIDPDKRTPAQKTAIINQYLKASDPEFQATQTKLDAAHKREAEINAVIPTVMIMKEMTPPRKTFVLERGMYDAPKEQVTAQTPAFLPPMPKDAPPSRLGLAEWMTDPSHPLTARVAVNRFWCQYFGVGLVKTVEDWGAQGEPPSHPDLLAWLAFRFVNSGWDVKAMQRLIVTSATYCQAARFTPELLERDPENRLLAHGPRVRLSAEAIRDNALAVSGLLVNKVGGPSVMPYQPAGLWDDLVVGAAYPGTKYVQGKGDDLYRRSMYTFWKRTVPPPTLATFDAPDRESCVLRRPKTNTPLQALALMNDPMFIEAGRKLAERMMHEGGERPEQRIEFLFQLATARPPNAKELVVLRDTFSRRLAHYKGNPDAAAKLIAIGESKSDPKLEQCELAAYTTVANMVLNLDEVIAN